MGGEFGYHTRSVGSAAHEKLNPQFCADYPHLLKINPQQRCQIPQLLPLNPQS